MAIGVDLPAVQRSIDTLDSDVEIASQTLSKGGLGKREKLRNLPPPDDAYINVVISVAPGAACATHRLPDAIDRIKSKCDQQLEKVTADGMLKHALPRQNLISATIPITFLDDLSENEDVAFVQPAEPLKLNIPSQSAAKIPKARKIAGSKHHKDGAEVLIGIIDVGGFDFAHKDFRGDDGKTRFIAIWDQKANFRAPPAMFDYGTEFTEAHLGAAMVAAAAPGGLPATLLERQSQMIEGSHGTHVASTAAGRRGLCPEAKIAAVVIDVPEPENDRERRKFTFSDSSRILHAVEYLLDVARKKGLPISINISLGTNGGAHDGSGGVTRWMDHALTTPGRSICIAAGNAGQERPLDEQDLGWMMGRIHASGKIASKGLDFELGWVVVGDGVADISENELEIWYSAQDRFQVELLPPGESAWIKIGPQEFMENKRLKDGTTVSIYNELYNPANGINSISLYLSPNLQSGNIRRVRPGTWRVRLVGEEIRDGRFHCWIERDDPQNFGQAEGERLMRFPSFFAETSNVDSHSISSLACGHETIAVANYDSAIDQVNITSSQGPTRDGRSKPDITAPGTNVVAAKGFSSDDDAWIAMSGTSMASPYVTGVIGLMLSVNRNLNAAQCLGILQRTARPLPGSTYAWCNDAGFGRIDPKAAIEEARRFTERKERRGA